jgi:hypothetical protein
LHRIEAIPAPLHPSWDFLHALRRENAVPGLPAARPPWHADCFIQFVCGMFSSPLVRHFLLDGRVQERKGLHAFFFGPHLTGGRNPV